MFHLYHLFLIVNSLYVVYRVKKFRSNPPSITRGVHEGTPHWTKQDANKKHLLFLDGKSPRRGLGLPKVKFEDNFCVNKSSAQTSSQTNNLKIEFEFDFIKGSIYVKGILRISWGAYKLNSHQFFLTITHSNQNTKTNPKSSLFSLHSLCTHPSFKSF